MDTKLNFKFNVEDYSTSNSESENFSYKEVYKYAVKHKLKFSPKDFRKKVQNLKLTDQDLFILIDSGFVNENKNKAKFELLRPTIDAFIKKYSTK